MRSVKYGFGPSICHAGAKRAMGHAIGTVAIAVIGDLRKDFLT